MSRARDVDKFQMCIPAVRYLYCTVPAIFDVRWWTYNKRVGSVMWLVVVVMVAALYCTDAVGT